jgi:hypothetical protein
MLLWPLLGVVCSHEAVVEAILPAACLFNAVVLVVAAPGLLLRDFWVVVQWVGLFCMVQLATGNRCTILCRTAHRCVRQQFSTCWCCMHVLFRASGCVWHPQACRLCRCAPYSCVCCDGPISVAWWLVGWMRTQERELCSVHHEVCVTGLAGW